MFQILHKSFPFRLMNGRSELVRPLQYMIMCMLVVRSPLCYEWTSDFYSLYCAHLCLVHIINVSLAFTGKKEFKGMVLKIVYQSQ